MVQHSFIAEDHEGVSTPRTSGSSIGVGAKVVPTTDPATSSDHIEEDSSSASTINKDGSTTDSSASSSCLLGRGCGGMVTTACTSNHTLKEKKKKTNSPPFKVLVTNIATKKNGCVVQMKEVGDGATTASSSVSRAPPLGATTGTDTPASNANKGGGGGTRKVGPCSVRFANSVPADDQQSSARTTTARDPVVKPRPAPKKRLSTDSIRSFFSSSSGSSFARHNRALFMDSLVTVEETAEAIDDALANKDDLDNIEWVLDNIPAAIGESMVSRRRLVADRNAISNMIKLIDHCIDLPDATGMCRKSCLAVRHLCKGSSDVAVKLGEFGACESMTRMLWKHKDIVLVAEAACAAMTHLAVSEANRLRLIEAGALE